MIDFNKYPDMLSAGGGFGPVSDDGYGVSYIICHEDLIMFHVSNVQLTVSKIVSQVSSKTTCPTTSSKRFAHNIEKAMLDIAAIMEVKW